MILLKNMLRYFALSFSVLMGAVLTWVLTVVMTDTAPTWFFSVLVKFNRHVISSA